MRMEGAAAKASVMSRKIVSSIQHISTGSFSGQNSSLEKAYSLIHECVSRVCEEHVTMTADLGMTFRKKSVVSEQL